MDDGMSQAETCAKKIFLVNLNFFKFQGAVNHGLKLK